MSLQEQRYTVMVQLGDLYDELYAAVIADELDKVEALIVRIHGALVLLKALEDPK